MGWLKDMDRAGQYEMWSTCFLSYILPEVLPVCQIRDTNRNPFQWATSDFNQMPHAQEDTPQLCFKAAVLSLHGMPVYLLRAMTRFYAAHTIAMLQIIPKKILFES